MKRTNKTLIYASAALVFSQVALAQTTPMSRPVLNLARPAIGGLGAAAPAAAAPKDNALYLAAQKQLAEKQVKMLAQKEGYVIEEALAARLVSAMVKNKSVEQAVMMIVGEKSAKTAEVNMLRLEILSLLGDINPHDAAQIKAASNDMALQGGIRVARLVTNLNSRGISEEGVKNILIYMTALKESIVTGLELGDALDIARRTTAMEGTVEVDNDLIDEVFTTPDGVVSLFKGANDRQLLTVTGPNGQPLDVRMTPAQYEELQKEAWDMALELHALAKDPSSLQENMATKALANLNKSSDSAQIFLDQNPLLDRRSGFQKERSDNVGEVSNNINELLDSLKEYNGLVTDKGLGSIAGKIKDVAASTPFLGKYVTNAEHAVSTSRTKIETIDKKFVQSANQLAANNVTLMDIKGRSMKKRENLDFEIVRVKLTSDYILHMAEQAEAAGDAALGDTLRSEISRTLESKKNRAMTFSLSLGATEKAFTQLIAQGNALIERGSGLRDVAIPIISINQTAQEAGKDIAADVKQQKKVSMFLTNQFVTLGDTLKTNGDMINELSKLPLIAPEVLTTFQNKMAQIESDGVKAQREAAESLRIVNDDLSKMMNAGRIAGDRDSVGMHSYNMVNGTHTGVSGSTHQECASAAKKY